MVEIIRLRGVGPFKAVDSSDSVSLTNKSRRVKDHYTIREVFETMAFSTFFAQKHENLEFTSEICL